MPYTPLKIHIPEPCGENWEAMSSVSGTTARHCDTCAKEVVDFTGFTDSQVHAYLLNNNGKLCGRFRADQIGRPLHAVEKPKASALRVAAATAGLLMAATGCEAPATTGAPSKTNDPQTEQVLTRTVEDGLVFEPPLTGEIESVTDGNQEGRNKLLQSHPARCPSEDTYPNGTLNDEILMTVPGMIGSAAPPPPPPLPPPPPTIVGDLSYDEVDESSLTISPPSPPPPLPNGPVMKSADLPVDANTPPHAANDLLGLIAFEAPEVPRRIDSLLSILSMPPGLAPQPTSHPRPRPKTPPPHLQDLEPYPNPFVDELTLELNVPETTTATVELLDASGRRILRQNWPLEAGFNTLTLRPLQRKLKGQLYYLRVIQANDESVTKPVIRQ